MRPVEVEVRSPVLPRASGTAGRRLLVVALVQLGFLAAVLVLSACYAPGGKVTALDQLALPGEKIVFSAKVERDGPGFLNRDLSGVELEFLGPPAAPGPPVAANPPLAPDPAGALPEGARPLGRATSARGGVAELPASAPETPGNHLYWVRLKDPRRLELRHPLVVFTVTVIPPGQPIVITDIDNTIATTRLGGLGRILDDEPDQLEPLSGAAEVLAELARSQTVVYLTARSSYLAYRTRHWLAHHRFPAGPVLLRDVGAEWRGFQWSESDFKKRVISASIKSRWPQIRWGIGNTVGDAEAYTQNGIRAVILGTEAQGAADRFPQLVRPAADWKEVRKIVVP